MLQHRLEDRRAAVSFVLAEAELTAPAVGGVRLKGIEMRIQIELPEENVKEIKALMEEAGIDTYKELFSNALGLLYWAVQEVKRGRAIASIDEEQEKYKELVMPLLQNVATKARQRMPASSARKS